MSRLAVSFRRVVMCLLSAAAALLLLPTRSASAQPMAPSVAALPAGYAAQILSPAWRSALPSRAAFGSLCSLGPLACALIDRPFAFNARLDLAIRPNASDGSTGVMLPFAVSVPLFGRAEVGLGSCYSGFWASKEEAAQANADPSVKRPSGLCPFWLAAKLLIFPWFRDPHTNPALAVEYQFEYQAGPFSGLNQLGLPGHLSKLSLAYRHPLGRLELGAALSILVDHTTRAGTLQFGPHVGYRLPVGEHFWFYGQAMVQAPSWGPVIPSDTPGRALNLAPLVAGTVAVGAQQRADFGFGAGLTLMLTKSELETRVDLMFRLLNFEVGPHIKPLIPAKEKRDEPQNVAVSVKPQAVAPRLECPPGYQLAPAPQPTLQATDPQTAIPNPAPVEPKCISIPPPYRIPSPRWGQPCYLAPLDGSEALRMGNIDSTGQYCDWGGLRLPLGAVIEPPQRVPQELEKATPAAPTAAPVPPGTAAVEAPPARPGTLPAKAPQRGKAPAAVVAAAPPPAQIPSRPAPRPAAGQDHIEQVSQQPPSVPGSAFASGFVDGGKDAYDHARDFYRAIKKHGPGVVLPSGEAVEAWVKEVQENCLERIDDCVRDKAKEAAQALNDFRKKPWEGKKYTAGRWAWGAVQMTAEGAVAAALPGAGAVVRAGEEVVEHELAKKAAKAAVKTVGKDAAEEAGEAAARQAAKEAAEAEAKRVAEAEALRTAEANAAREATHGERLPWGAWRDYPKVVDAGQEYAQIGQRLYTEHATQRMLPTGMGGRGIAPGFVEAAIEHGTTRTQIVKGVTRTIHTAGNVQVVTEQGGRIIVTVMRVGGP